MTFLIIFFAIAAQVFLTAKKVSPFLSLLVVAILAGLCFGMSPALLLKSIEKGVGSTLGGLVLIICLGSILGKILEVSGAIDQISATLIKKVGLKNIQWAIMLTGLLIGIPLYYNAGFVILVPLVFILSRKSGLPLLYLAIPMAASLSTTHCFLPPHPGPVVLINAFKANTGKVLLYGILIAIPAVVIAGPLFGRFLLKMKIDTTSTDEAPSIPIKKLPNVVLSFMIALLPVILITCSILADNFLTEGSIIKQFFLFIGDSTIALLLSVLVALYFFGIREGIAMGEQMTWVTTAVTSIAMIILIITSGGVLKQVLQDSGTATYIASLSGKLNLSPLFFGWLVTALLRVTIGSATVSGITAAGIVSPLVLSGVVSPELMVLAVGSGSVFGSHINDSGFWIFKEFFHLTLRQTFLSWSVMETIISLVGLAGVLILSNFV